MSCILYAAAQDPKTPKSKSDAPAATAKPEPPKNEVDQILDEANKAGERVFTACVQDCGESETGNTSGLEVCHVLELPQPEYPALAARAHVSGEVRVQLVIGNDGAAIAAHAISGHPLLQASSVAAARKARFTPTLFEGKPVKVAGVIVYNFVRQ